jgi:hypothetical protein
MYRIITNAATENNSNACAVKGGNHSTTTENRYHIINGAKPESLTRGNFLKRLKIYFMASVVALSLVFVATSCDDDRSGGGGGGGSGSGSGDGDGGTTGSGFNITASNLSGVPNSVKTVKALMYWENGNEYEEEVIAQVPYKNNGFTLQLPATLNNKFLSSISDASFIILKGNAKNSINILKK